MAYFSRKSRYDTLSDELWKERSEGTNLTLISPNFLCANTSAGRIVPRPRDIIPRNESKKSDPARDSESAPEPTPEGNTHKPRWKAYREHVYQYREEKGQNRDGKKNRYETHILDVLKSKDLTMHLDLNIVEDIEQDLDEFCRLARLGNFHAAKRFFFENLEEQMSNPYVFVQYAQMLLDMGNYAAIAGLRTPDGLDGIDMLRVNWNLVWLLAEIHIRGVSKHHVNHVATEAIELWSRRDPPGSTEVQILSLILRILAQRYSSDENHGVDVSFDWAGIYKQLLSEGRIWDFRDLFVAMLSYSGEHATCHCFLGVHFDSPALIDKLVRDWSTDTFDESISLALLDIIAFLCLAPGLTSGKYDAAKRCLEYSRRIASSLAENDAGLLMTGPYLRWSLAKARVATYITPEISGESTPLSFPSPQKTGQFLYRTWAIDIPLYVPIESELIDWKSITRPPYANDTIQIVLNAANQLGDYNTDALGRQLLVYRSQDPLKQFDELIALQTTVQLDMYGGLHTILGRYVMCKDENDRKNLRDEILADYNPEDLPSSLQRARTAVLRAISEPKLDNVVSDQEGSKSEYHNSNVWNEHCAEKY
ncbi:hypothetical protein F5Y01DRAFT_218609 [Xylaria sp. FL0043]|nr:hypothetical protein F5Y01DRAFT_218609 [Xylaria sp. FL0043]